MFSNEMLSGELMKDIKRSSDRRRVLITGGFIGALLASSCCILPLLLVMLGVGGVWVGSLTALAPYQWVFLLIAIICLGAGFWQIYFVPKAACTEGAFCDRYTSSIAIKSILWIGTVLVVATIAINVLTPFFY